MMASRVLLLALSLSLLAVNARALDVSALAEKVKPSVVHLSILDGAGRPEGNGTGFFVSSSGWIVTNHHVIRTAQKMKAKLADGSERNIVGVLADDEQNDLAIVQAEGSGYPALELADASSVKEGLDVLVIGSPEGFSFTISSGNISALRLHGVRGLREEDPKWADTPAIQITAPTTHGSSGSPVVLMDGHVAGVVQSGLDTRGNIEFAVFVPVLKALRDTVTSTTQPKPFARERSPLRNLLYSAIFFGGIGVVFVGGQAVQRWRSQRRSRLKRKLKDLQSTALKLEDDGEE